MSLRSGSPCTSTSRPISSWKRITRSISPCIALLVGGPVDLALAQLHRGPGGSRRSAGTSRSWSSGRAAGRGARAGPRLRSAKGLGALVVLARSSAVEPLAHLGVAGPVGVSPGSSSARSLASSSSAIASRPRRAPWRASRPRPPSATANDIHERSSSSRSASTPAGSASGRSASAAASRTSRRRAGAVRVCEAVAAASSECSRSLIQTLRPSTTPAKSVLSSSPPWPAMNSALCRPPCSWTSALELVPVHAAGKSSPTPSTAGRAARRRRRRRGRSRS